LTILPKAQSGDESKIQNGAASRERILLLDAPLPLALFYAEVNTAWVLILSRIAPGRIGLPERGFLLFGVV
jgi:hypothetical protein